MDKLISMTEYVLHKNRFKEDSDTAVFKITNYANFLKQPLNIGMFVPCDDEGNVLETPIDIYYRPDFMCQKYPQECYEGDLKSYNKAKEKVLFEGFEYDSKMEYWHNNRVSFDEEYIRNKTIEDLVPYNLTLTKNAIDKHEL